ncbi:nitroreductase [Oceaniovalibus guishaninsula JLT2003]|uniref:Nitroreductase n=1 Tax=Oceaniovalibus guishaninsula JLT2003 TaxID=1231392 RepID=K2HJS3_9RHOB|nr:nitroreductase [Oceaniovalibus guishaninsula JLT2003]
MLDAIAGRRSVRAFLATPVPRKTVTRILNVAARAPSGTNIQPWQAVVLTGAARARFCDRLIAHVRAGGPAEQEYSYYPQRWRDPYLSRRRKVGWDLYASLGIGKGDRDATARQHLRNYAFFDAPVGMIFTMDRDMEIGSWLDLGMFLQNAMIAARAFGLDTCPQAAFARYPATIARLLDIAPDRQVIVGMALGHRDPDAPENGFATNREDAASFARFVEE